MFLLVSPTLKELDALTVNLEKDLPVFPIVSGVGILESSLTLQKFVSGSEREISGVLLAGIGGAFSDGGAGLLDICLASKEVLGDLGICRHGRIEPLDDSFAPVSEFLPDLDLFASVVDILSGAGTDFHQGPFVTVSSVSGTKERGDFLQKRHGAVCENMEGAAVARICREFDLPWIEIRCISNMVLDRDEQRWDFDGAISRCSEAVGLILEHVVRGF